LIAIHDKLWFPPVQTADEDGLLAFGGDLRPERLLLAYRSGIFPWYEGDLPLWWSPDPRFVLLPEQLIISKSMQTLLKRDAFTFTINKDFAAVIRHCKETERRGQDSTWITDEVERAFIGLHQQGYAHSAEAWKDGQLVGGLYGLRMGRVFFGESMFSHQSNASKYAFIKYVHQLKQEGVTLIDCQVYTPHLESLGAAMMERSRFVEWLQLLIG
jgi:leucyl/phenylalanyl-tRNA--protein transferase